MSEGGPFQLGVVVDIGDPQPKPVAPEMEDVVFNTRRTQVVGHLDSDEFRGLLEGVAEDSLGTVFGPAIVRKSPTAAAVPQHTGAASLGVLRTNDAELTLQTRFDPPDLHVHFVDPDFGELAIKVTDLRL